MPRRCDFVGRLTLECLLFVIYMLVVRGWTEEGGKERGKRWVISVLKTASKHSALTDRIAIGGI